MGKRSKSNLSKKAKRLLKLENRQNGGSMPVRGKGRARSFPVRDQRRFDSNKDE